MMNIKALRKKYRIAKPTDYGFTIIELLIATSVFSIVLLILTFGVIQITDSYYKGITQSNTQNAARNIINDVSQSLQFNGGSFASPPAGVTSGFYCIGAQRYSFVLGKELEDSPQNSDQTAHTLVLDATPGCSQQSSTSYNAGWQELLSPNMRLAAFSITAVGNSTTVYRVDVRVVYGDGDLLTTAASGSHIGSTITCNTGDGSQFCAASELSTVVERRVQ